MPPPFGGIANQTKQLKGLLEKEQVWVHFLPTNAPYFPRWVSKVKGIRAIIRLIPYVYHLWKVAGKVDAFHIMANSGWAWHLFAAPAIWVAYIRNKPVILNYRGGNADKFFQSSFSLVKPTISKPAKIIVPSQFLVDIFARYGLHADIIPNIIDSNLFKPKYANNNDRKVIRNPHIIVTRNLESIYDNKTAIRAFCLLSQEFPGSRLTIAGTGQEQKDLQSLVDASGLKSRVKFAGRLDREEIAQLLASADAMLNPSLVDNMPNSVLEALACNVPIVSTNVGGISHILEDRETALLVNPGDHKAMANAVCTLLKENVLRKEVVSKGQASVQRYRWATVKYDWLQTYESILR